MPNKDTHIKSAIITDVVVQALEFNFSPGLSSSSYRAPVKFFLRIFASAFGAIAPDLLEPAIHPNHRAFAHSYSVGALLVGLYNKLPNFIKNEILLDTTRAFILGYASHLLLDSQTPKGLKFI